MPPPSRTRRILKWTGFGLSLLSLLIWVASFLWFGRVRVGGRIALAILWGRLACEVYPSGRLPPFVSSIGILPYTDLGIRNRGWPWTAGPTPPLQTVDIPLSFVLIVTAIPTAWLFHRDRRRIRPGCCLRCGYDLTGNPSVVCTECGAPTAPAPEKLGR